MALALPSLRDVPSFTGDERRALADLAARGLSMGEAVATRGLDLPEGTLRVGELQEAKSFVCRRWVFDTLLRLEEAPRGFNALRRELGSLAGESLATKLHPLVVSGLLERRLLARAPLGVEYALTGPGSRVALAVHVATIAYAQRVRAVLDPAEGGAAPAAAPRSGPDLEAYLALCARLVERRQAAVGDDSAELAAASRFGRLCMMRWHIDAMRALSAGPRRFGEMKRILGARDKALALALSNLRSLECVTKDASGAYALLPAGYLLAGLGVPIAVLTWQARHDRAAARASKA